jgi:hypothetical protein
VRLIPFFAAIGRHFPASGVTVSRLPTPFSTNGFLYSMPIFRVLQNGFVEVTQKLTDGILR